MSKVVGFVIGAALIVVGAATGNVGLIIQGSAMIVTQAIVDLTAPKVPARQASEMSIQLGETPRVAQFGETATAGSLVDGFNYGGKYGTDWECLVIRLADHPCASLTGFFVNDEYNPYTGDGLVARYDDQLEIYFRSDTTNQALPSRVTDHGPGWTSADIGESGCDVVVCYKADKAKDKHPGWPGGRPRFLFVLKGKLCYDPRKDSTITGGSGAHRWDDASTWEWSENPVICRYNWARGIYANDDVSDPSKLLVGRGLTAEEAPPENIFAAANLCDEVVAGVFPFEYLTTSESTRGAFFSPSGTRLVIAGGTTFEVWDVVTRTRIVGPISTHVGGSVAVNDDGSFYAAGYGGTGTTGVMLVSASGGAVELSNDGMWGGIWQVAAGIFGRTATDTSNVLELAGDTVTSTAVGFVPSWYLDRAGVSWAVGGAHSGGSYLTGIGFCTVPGGTPTIISTTTSGEAYAVVNPDGLFFVWQANKIYLIDPATMTITAGPVAAVYTGPPVSGANDALMRGARNGDAFIWIGFKKYSTTDLSVLQTETASSWTTTGIGGAIYDRINNALWTRSQLDGEITIRYLDRHGGYRIAGPVYSNQEFIDVEQMFAAATAGNVITHEGSVELEPGQAKSVVATITDADLLTGAAVNWNNGILSEANAEWVNSVVARYVEPDLQWQDHATPIARDTDDIIADGRPREASITLRLVRHLQQAQRVAEINRRLGRLQGRAKVKLGPRFCWLENGDWIAWQSDRYFGGSTKTFRIDVDATDEKWQITLTLREIAASVYADDAELPVDQSHPTTTPTPADIGAPDSGSWALSPSTLVSAGASVPALTITGGATDDDNVESIIAEYWVSDGVLDPVADPDSIPWIVAGTYAPSTTKIQIGGLTGGATYYVALTYVVDGIPGDRLVMGPQTVADLDVSGQMGLTVDTVTGTSYAITATDGWHHKRFTNAGSITLTVPTNATAAYPIGQRTRITQSGAGQITLSPAVGVTLNSRDAALKSAGQKAVLEIEKVGTDEWDVLGDVTV